MAKVIVFSGDRLMEHIVELDRAVTLGYILNKVNISREEVGFAICRSKYICLDDLVNPEDEVRIFPPLGGG
jgi:molybdopterin synthase sulfur carrier subunit